ncbi:MAG: hypothetical protein M3O15_02785, partial [Acidobacteriota bacterium]|nr:hypothetical protein [Acidobacteriota bacterium]
MNRYPDLLAHFCNLIPPRTSSQQVSIRGENKVVVQLVRDGNTVVVGSAVLTLTATSAAEWPGRQGGPSSASTLHWPWRSTLACDESA